MQSERRHCAGRGFFFPLLLIALGVIFLADQLHWVRIGNAFAYIWPAILILFGIELLSFRPRGPRLVVGVLAVVFGAALVLTNLGYLAFDIGNLWPVVLIAVGVAMLFRPGFYGRRYRHYRGRWVTDPNYGGHWEADAGSDSGSNPGGNPGAGPEPGAPAPSGDNATLDAIAVLGGVQRRITAQNFTGGSIYALFGGFQLDLTQAAIAGPQAVLDLSALFGGGEVRVPDGWIIDIQGQSLFGAYTDETRQSVPAPGAPRLVIQGTAVFGGVVIKN